jgi:protein TonB
MGRPDPAPSHGGGRRWLAWTVFAVVLLIHAEVVLMLRDLLHRKQQITPPEPIVVTLVEAPQPPAELAGEPAAEPAVVAPRPQPPAPPREAVAPVVPPAPPEPVARPQEPPPEPVAEPPPAPPLPRPQAIAPEPPVPPAPPPRASEPAPPPATAAVPAPAAPGPANAMPAPAAAAGSPAPSAPTPPSYNATYLDNPKPVYPMSARQRRLEGTVRLRVFVNAAGTVDEVQLHQTSGSPLLDRSALEAVKQWRFIPAREGDRAVPAWVIVPIVFTLKG